MAIDLVLAAQVRLPRFGAVLLVDDHPLVRAGLAALLTCNDGRQLVVEAGSVEAAEDALAIHPAMGLILYDWHMPSIGGCRGLQRIREAAPDVPVVVVTGDDDDAITVAARTCGAVDVVSKAISGGEMRRRLAPWLTEAERLPPTPAPALQPASSLSKRHREVLVLLARGHANKRIADTLGIQEATVRAHMTDIFRILKVRNRTEAALTTARLGLLDEVNARLH